jgi:hypothetical protein
MSAGRILCFMTVLALVAGYVGVVRRGEAAIADQRAAQAQIGERLAADEQRLGARATLESERTLLQGHLRRFELAGNDASLVARFVHDAVSIAAQDRLAIVAIAADQGAPNGAPSSGAPNAGAFTTTPLDVTLEGAYGDVLRGVRDLSRARVLTRVELASLLRTHPDGPGTTVTAALRVAVERLASRGDANAHPGPT